MPKKRLTIIVVGAGRLGRALAGYLSANGDSVTVIDSDSAALDQLPAEFTGFRIEGNAGELETLIKARMEGADLVYAVTDSDNLNLMVAQAAQHWFGVKRTIARVSNASRERLYASLGVTTVNPIALSVTACLEHRKGD